MGADCRHGQVTWPTWLPFARRAGCEPLGRTPLGPVLLAKVEGRDWIGVESEANSGPPQKRSAVRSGRWQKDRCRPDILAVVEKPLANHNCLCMQTPALCSTGWIDSVTLSRYNLFVRFILHVPLCPV
jgi:hypothetical protein